MLTSRQRTWPAPPAATAVASITRAVNAAAKDRANHGVQHHQRQHAGLDRVPDRSGAGDLVRAARMAAALAIPGSESGPGPATTSRRVPPRARPVRSGPVLKDIRANAAIPRRPPWTSPRLTRRDRGDVSEWKRGERPRADSSTAGAAATPSKQVEPAAQPHVDRTEEGLPFAPGVVEEDAAGREPRRRARRRGWRKAAARYASEEQAAAEAGRRHRADTRPLGIGRSGRSTLSRSRSKTSFRTTPPA